MSTVTVVPAPEVDEVTVSRVRTVPRRRAVWRNALVFMPAVLIAIAGWSHRWMDEDAFINLRVVDQIFAGHGPVFNAGERIESATSVLWIVVLVVGRAAFGAFVGMQWIALVSALLAAVAAFAVAGQATRALHRGTTGVVVPVGLFVAVAVTAVWDFSTSGLEMGLVWLWLATSWLVLVTAVRADRMTGRGRTLGAVVLGLGPLVRPDLALTAACLIVAWFLLARPRRVGGDVVAVFALPVVYQVFRMGYYAALVPTTALAKDAGGLHVAQGRHYASDFVGAYALWLPLAVVVAIIGRRVIESRDRRFPIAAIAMVVGGLLHACYIVAIGGDYMHARLLLPGFFAILLPASIVVRRRDTVVLGLIGVAAAWAIVSAVAFRPPPPPPMYGVASVADWRVVQGAKVVPKDDAFGFNGYESAAAYERGVRGLVEITSQHPVAGADPTKLYVTMGSIGVPAWHAGEHVWVVDIGGLAEPIAARTTPVDGRPAGHRKQVDDAWYAARFGAAPGDAKVVAARHALSCGPVSGLLEAVTGELTPRRFLSNIFHSVQYTRLHIPAGPAAAERKFC